MSAGHRPTMSDFVSGRSRHITLAKGDTRTSRGSSGLGIAPCNGGWSGNGRQDPWPRSPTVAGWHSPIDMAILEAVVREVPDATVAELCWAYNRRVPRAARTTRTSFGRAMRRADFVLKKTGRGRARWIVRTSPRNDD